MISVIIPYMGIEPYKFQLGKCISSIKKQTADIEIIVVKQKPVVEYIEKTRLLNEGVAKAKGNIIWFCDADFLLPDKTMLKGMEAKLKKDSLDCIFPMFYSAVFSGYKIADGGPFMKKSKLKEFGKLDESLIGIGGVYFDLLEWILDNDNFYCDPEFLINLNYFPFTTSGDKAPPETLKRTKSLIRRVKSEFKKRGLWPK